MHLVIAMAGEGSRTRAYFKGPKPFAPIGERYLLEYALCGLPWDEISLVTFAVNDEVDQWIRSSSIEMGQMLPDGVVSRICNVGTRTNGQAATVSLCLPSEYRHSQLLISNCDTFFSDDFPRNRQGADGLLGTFKSTSSNLSYARVENGLVFETAEKRVISNRASSGLYYFRKQSLFQDALSETKQSGEAYIAPLYNHLIGKGLKVKEFQQNTVEPLGTLDEIEAFLASELPHQNARTFPRTLPGELTK